MDTLFTPVKIDGLQVPNRFVRSATYDGGADKGGFVSDWQIELYGAFARGGVGLISSRFFSSPLEARLHPTKLITDDKFIPGLKRLADTVHAHGSKLAVQLFHPGREAFRRLHLLGVEAVAPSAVKCGRRPLLRGQLQGNGSRRDMGHGERLW